MDARFRGNQIIRLVEFASTELHIDLSVSRVAGALKVSHSAMKRAKLRGKDPPVQVQHHELAAGAEQQLG
jgi:hypothetical protein